MRGIPESEEFDGIDEGERVGKWIKVGWPLFFSFSVHWSSPLSIRRGLGGQSVSSIFFNNVGSLKNTDGFFSVKRERKVGWLSLQKYICQLPRLREIEISSFSCHLRLLHLSLPFCIPTV